MSTSAKRTLRILTVLSILNGKIIKHDPYALHESEKTCPDIRTLLVRLMQLLSYFIIKKIRGLKWEPATAKAPVYRS